MSPAEAFAWDEASGLSERDAQALLDRQVEVLELIARAAPLHDVLHEILTSLEDLMEDGRCSVLLLDREQGTLHHGAAPRLPHDYVAAIDGLSIGDGAGSCGSAAALNAPVIATDVRTDPRWVDYRQLAEAAGLRSCWSTPIEGRDGLPVGTFAVYHPHPHHPGRRERLLVERFTHLASVAIDHAGLVGELVESEERFRRSFDDNSLGMAILGPDHTIATSNNALTALAGAAGSLTGRSLDDIVTPRERSIDSLLEELGVDGAQPIVFEAVLHHPRRDVEVEVTVSILSARAGSPAKYVVNVFDLTERRAAERDRRARLAAETARRTAEQHSRAMSELLAAVGHEARTPIQAIVGFAELLGTMDLDEARRHEALGHIDAAAGHVMDLLADVLDLSRLEARALPLVLEPVVLRDVADEALSLLSTHAGHRRIALSATLGDEVVLADRRRLRQVLLNLVGNSVRHGNSDGRVEVRSEVASDDDDAVSLVVIDDGPGIPPDLLPRLFTPFTHTEAARAEPGDGDRDASEESVGLGLTLAHGLMRAMGGDLTVRATSADGTSMLVRIPRVGEDAR